MKKTVLLFFIFIVYRSNAQGVWTQKANLPGPPRGSGSAFSIGGKGYSGLGQDGTNNLYNDLWEYDPLLNAWTQKAAMPSGRYVCSTFSIGTKAYVCMGAVVYASVITPEVWEYDQPSNTWTRKNDFPAAERYGSTAFAMNGKGYVCCGNEGSATGPFNNELWEYDPASDTWTQKTNFPGVPRYGMYGHFLIAGKAYVGLGGYKVGTTYYFLSDMYAYDPSADTWTPIANYPGAGKVYTVGFVACGKGCIGTGLTSGTAFSDFWEYDVNLDMWKPMAGFAGNRWAMTNFTVNGRTYAGTGWDMNQFYNDWWEYSCPIPTGEAESNGLTLFSITNFSSGVFTVQSAEKIRSIEIYNLLGENIYSEKIESPSTPLNKQIDLSTFPKGIYFVELSNGKARSAKKLLLQ